MYGSADHCCHPGRGGGGRAVSEVHYLIIRGHSKKNLETIASYFQAMLNCDVRNMIYGFVFII
jgi:hypothetical protein